VKWYYPAGAIAALGAAWLAFRNRGAVASTAESAVAAAKEWAGDPKLLQQAINAALSAARTAGREGVPKALTVDGRPGAMTCRAAEWLVSIGLATADMRAFAGSTKCGAGMKRAPCGISGPLASGPVKQAVLDAIEKQGYPRSQGERTVSRESGWHPMAVACAGADKHPVAGGLMQFISIALKSVDFPGSPDQFAALSGETQLPYLLKFIGKMPRSKLGRPGEFGLALFTPGFVDKAESTVIYEVNSLGWTQNPGLRTAGGGPITVGSVLKTTA
jgi:hypothetical protein